ncbi:MAG: class I SAM-dependent methyltransferase [Sulfurimonas sp.]|nr:class I SAM-dependent methyltransferase [Sulfurimonas sp.]
MNKWDKKAKNYSRYGEDKDRFENRIFDALDSLHVEFQDKTLLDIGCGTGVYTLHLAKKCSHIDGIDSSKEMLEVLKEDAKKLNLTNTDTLHIGWDSFTCKEVYDYALCTMSPAIREDRDLEKMTKCAKTKIYLGWAGKRETHIIEALFKAHGSSYSPPNGAKKVKEWLNKNSKFYQVIPFDEEKIRTREFDEAVENFEWHLDVRGLKPDKKKIVEVLEKFRDKENCITETTINHFNLIVW